MKEIGTYDDSPCNTPSIPVHPEKPLGSVAAGVDVDDAAASTEVADVALESSLPPPFFFSIRHLLLYVYKMRAHHSHSPTQQRHCSHIRDA